MYKSEEGVFYERPNLFNGAKERKMVPAEDLHNVEIVRKVLDEGKNG